jgi:hypothetical protein
VRVQMRDEVRVMLDQYLVVHNTTKGPAVEEPHNLRHTFALPGARTRPATPNNDTDAVCLVFSS